MSTILASDARREALNLQYRAAGMYAVARDAHQAGHPRRARAYQLRAAELSRAARYYTARSGVPR